MNWDQIGDIQKPEEPSFSEELLKKAKTLPDFYESDHLISLVTGQPYADLDTDAWKPRDTQPTALENLYAIVYCLRKAGIAVQHDTRSGETFKDRFLRAFVIDQST